MEVPAPLPLRTFIIVVKQQLTLAAGVRMVCTVKRQLFESPHGAIAVLLKASKIWIVQSNQTVRSPDGE